ncbi:MAG: ATP-binding cassette domain-containing protein [Ignavibacteria bacterium]|jgi:ABC-2 type transport system ATP-binding protein
MIELKNISISFGDNCVLNELTSEFNTSEIHGVVGLNGAGKTTLFNAIAKVIEPDSGQILFNENNIKRSDTEFLETENYFYSNITGSEYLKIFSASNKDFSLNAFRELFKIPLDELIETYSNGMKKKLALMAVLKQDKPIYIFDEPFNGLDLETNKVLEIVIKKLKEKGKTVFISSHILEPLIDICDNIHLLSGGIIKASYKELNYSELKRGLFDELIISADKILRNSI